VKTQCEIYSQRQLCIRGRVVLANTLILSKLWYSLRIVPLPKHFFKQIRSIIYQFIMRGIKPGFQYALLCQPIIKGGLGLLDPRFNIDVYNFAGYGNCFKMTIQSPAVKCI
jgi:hypothetical protein